jgi:hypothetical protein
MTAGLPVRAVPRVKQPLSSWQISTLVSVGGGLGLAAGPLVAWLIQHFTGITYATQLMVVGVVITSTVCCLLAIAAILRALAAIFGRS